MQFSLLILSILAIVGLSLASAPRSPAEIVHKKLNRESSSPNLRLEASSNVDINDKNSTGAIDKEAYQPELTALESTSSFAATSAASHDDSDIEIDRNRDREDEIQQNRRRNQPKRIKPAEVIDEDPKDGRRVHSDSRLRQRGESRSPTRDNDDYQEDRKRYSNRQSENIGSSRQSNLRNDENDEDDHDGRRQRYRPIHDRDIDENDNARDHDSYDQDDSSFASPFEPMFDIFSRMPGYPRGMNSLIRSSFAPLQAFADGDFRGGPGSSFSMSSASSSGRPDGTFRSIGSIVENGRTRGFISEVGNDGRPRTRWFGDSNNEETDSRH